MNKAIPFIAAGVGAAAGYLAHDEIKKDVGYGSYLIPHKYYVYKASREMGLPLSRALAHDNSKFRPDEWQAYSDWFNGPGGLQGTRNREAFLNFRTAVEKHYTRNEHHWRPKHLTPDQVPLDVKLESIADWYGVNRARGNTKETFKQWFERKKETFPIDKPTVNEAERRLFKTATAFSTSSEVFKYLRDNHIRFVMAGSYGMRHIRDNRDFDVNIHPEDYDKLKFLGEEKTLPHGDKYILIKTSDKDIEIYNDWVPRAFNYNTLSPKGFIKDEQGNPSWTLNQVKEWKQGLGRPKDLIDIELINHNIKLASMKKKENPYTSLEYIVASGDPMVKALTKGLPPDQQRSIWRRYAQVVLRNRNYGRKNKVAGDYIKTKVRE